MAIEDSRFYKHGGVDSRASSARRSRTSEPPRRAGRLDADDAAGPQPLHAGEPPADAHAQDPRGQARRRAREPAPGRAARIGSSTQYLNNVPYGTVGGQTAVGVQAAARVFFDKHTHELTLAESALLAGLPQAPTDYNPFLYPKRAKARRNEVLRKMAEQHYITQAQAHATRSPAGSASSRPATTASAARATSSTTSSPSWSRPTGVKTVAPGRPAGLHDDQPEVAEARARRRSPTTSTSPATRRPRSSRSTRATATSSRWPPRATYGTSKFNSPRSPTASRARRSR